MRLERDNFAAVAPLNGRDSGSNQCDLAARDCLHSATTVQRLSDTRVVLNGEFHAAERALLLDAVIAYDESRFGVADGGRRS